MAAAVILAKKNNEAKFPHSLTAREDEIDATDGFRSAIATAGRTQGSFKNGARSSQKSVKTPPGGGEVGLASSSPQHPSPRLKRGSC